jgi:acrylyl-CoA reductase (NADPH)
MFKALLLEEKDGKVASRVAELAEDSLPAGDVTVAVEHSTLNYNDGLILQGLGRLVRQYPHVPGIDFAGRVLSSDNPAWRQGDAVVLTGWRVGEAHWGGYAEKARVKGDWLVKLPAGLTTRQAMAIGTAGFTAMLAVMALEDHGLTPDKGEVLVTGAAGGVGAWRRRSSPSSAIRSRPRRGGRRPMIICASWAPPHRRARQHREASGKPLEAERWAAASMRWAAARCPRC